MKFHSLFYLLVTKYLSNDNIRIKAYSYNTELIHEVI